MRCVLNYNPLVLLMISPLSLMPMLLFASLFLVTPVEKISPAAEVPALVTLVAEVVVVVAMASGNRPVCQLCGRNGHVALKCYHRFDLSFQGND